MQNWKRLTLADIPWPETGTGVSGKFLGEDRESGPEMKHIRFDPNFSYPPHWHPVDTIYIFTAGEMRIGQEGVYRAGDVRWVRAGTFYGPEEAGPDGVEFLLIDARAGSLDAVYGDLGPGVRTSHDRSKARAIGMVDEEIEPADEDATAAAT